MDTLTRYLLFTAGYCIGAWVALAGCDWKDPSTVADRFTRSFYLGFALGLGLRWKLVGGAYGMPRFRLIFALRPAALAVVFVVVSVFA
jgi:hypothetical protein